MIGLVGFGISSLLCGLAPTLELIVLFRVLQGAAGALLVPGSLSIITAAFEGAARARAFGTVGGVDVGPDAVRPTARRAARRHALVAGRVPHQRPARRDRPVGDAAPHAGVARPARDRAGSTGSGRSSARSRSAGSPSGRSAASSRTGRTRSPGSSLAVGAVALVIFPILMAGGRTRSCRWSCSGSASSRSINLSTFLIYGALYVAGFYQSVLLQATLGYTATAASLSGLPTGILLVVLSSRVGAAAGRIGPKRFLVVGPLIMAAGLLWWARIPATSEPWRASLERPVDARPAAVALRRRPAGAHPVRDRDRARRRAADEHADELDPDPQCGPRIGDQQRAVTGRPAAHRGGHLHRRLGDVLRVLGSRVPGLDTVDPAVRREFPPLNPPKADVPPDSRRRPRRRRRSMPSVSRRSRRPCCSSAARPRTWSACAGHRRRSAEAAVSLNSGPTTNLFPRLARRVSSWSRTPSPRLLGRRHRDGMPRRVRRGVEREAHGYDRTRSERSCRAGTRAGAPEPAPPAGDPGQPASGTGSRPRHRRGPSLPSRRSNGSRRSRRGTGGRNRVCRPRIRIGAFVIDYIILIIVGSC